MNIIRLVSLIIDTLTMSHSLDCAVLHCLGVHCPCLGPGNRLIHYS